MTSKFYTVVEISSAGQAIEAMLDLRKGAFWSFRGQRRRHWHVGLHDKLPDDRLDLCLKQFRKRCMEFSRPDYIGEDDEWRWLFFAQHHRLKTRLLDWTTNPLVALYFAVENIISRYDDDKHFGVIWALRVSNEHFKFPEKMGEIACQKEWSMVNPPPVTHRLARQSGKFSYHPPNDDKPLDLIERRNQEEELIKYIIVRAKDGTNPTKKIRQQLGIMNIHHASLFPDPEGVAEFVNSEWPIIATDLPDPRIQPESPCSEG